MSTMSDEQRAEFLASLGLDSEGTTVAAATPKEAKAKTKKAKPVVKAERVDDIEFDASLLDDFVLDRTDIKQASDLLFQTYKYARGDERNKFLHRKITEFIDQVKRERNPKPRDGFIKGKVKAGKEERDLAQIIAEHDLTADDLAVMLQALAAHKAAQS